MKNVTQGGGGVRKVQKTVTYYLNGPLSCNCNNKITIESNENRTQPESPVMYNRILYETQEWNKITQKVQFFVFWHFTVNTNSLWKRLCQNRCQKPLKYILYQTKIILFLKIRIMVWNYSNLKNLTKLRFLLFFFFLLLSWIVWIIQSNLCTTTTLRTQK